MRLERELEVQHHWIIGCSIAIPSFCVSYPVQTILLLGKRLRLPDRIMMTVHGQEAHPKNNHFRRNKVDVWMECQCFSYLHGPFSAALAHRRRLNTSQLSCNF